MSRDVLKQVVFFSCKSVVVSKMCARLNNVCCLSPRLHKIPTFFFFFFSLLFRVLYDTLNPKKRHSRSLQGQHIWGGMRPQKTKSFFARAFWTTTTATKKPLSFPLCVFVLPPPRAPKPPVVLVRFCVPRRRRRRRRQRRQR